jgi:DDE_Tnp_1-associated
VSEIAIIDAFSGMSDHRRKQGRRHSLQLCLALFTLAVVAGNHGFLAIGDWLKSYTEELKELFEVKRIPSYSTIRRALLGLDYEEYSYRLANFFEIKPSAGETLAVDGKVLRGSYLLSEDNPYCEPHPAITLVSAYLVERGLILQPEEVESKSNEIKAVPKLIEALALEGVVVAFDAMNTYAQRYPLGQKNY